MRKSTAVALAAVALVSIAVRLLPLWSFLYWGSDTGEYFSILRALVRSDHLSTTYYGWGVTYPYFPGMFFAQAGFVDLGGLDVPTTINLLVPILGALGVLPMFLVAHRMTADDRFALFAAAFLAGAIPVAYTAAHTAPATVGELLALAGLLCFVRLRTDGRAMVPLLLVTATLIATHHLSLYFFLIMVFGAIVLEGLARPWRWTAGAKREVMFASVLLAGTFAYWLEYATTFRESILPDVNIHPWWAFLALFPAGLLLLGSAVVGIAVAPRVLLPYRHAEYLMVPLAIFAGIGFFRLLDLAGLSGGKRTLALGVCSVLLAANAVAGIPPPSTLAGWREGTTPSAVDPAYSARDHVSGLVVSDHQGSTTVFGFGGINATWDRTRDPFLPE